MASDLSSRCPWCGDLHEAVTRDDKSEVMPDSGDFTICFTCGRWGVFDFDKPGCIRKPTFAEAIAINESANCQQVRDSWERVVGERHKRRQRH